VIADLEGADLDWADQVPFKAVDAVKKSGKAVVTTIPGAETTKVYIALLAIIANLVVSVVLTFVFRAMGVDEGVDQTKDDDYWADEGDQGVELELDPLAEPHR